ncbi:MAG: sigma-70 family RNA polymerase sigma factor [Deltaproteobacteria bacterium]|nr:sigma-70 family RNA polymerase sigma factor [Deltaproteobacteria bacterium]
MLRITPLQHDATVTRLRIEGRVTQQTIAELTSSCSESFGTPQTLLLDLSGVPFVDTEGAATLSNLVEKGAVLIGCSGFLTELLHLNDSEEKGATPAQTEDVLHETQMIARLRRGDDAAFEQIVRQYSGRLLAVARRMLGGNEHDAQDVLQEAFLSVFKAIGEFTGAAKLSTWLHRIVVNAALMKLRSRRRKREESIDDLLPRFDAEGEWAGEVSSWETPSEELLQQRETRAAVRRCIDRLPESSRTVLLLRDIEELDTEEAASVLGITPNAVKIRLHRARQALRTLLERELASR